MIYVMSKDPRSKPGIYGEVKKQKCFMITDWASEEIDKVAAEFGMTRSDLIERTVRAGGLNLAKNFTLDEIDS